ncbi:receptor-interacting serine/threonine-protein kinase 4-like [Copidosoma floridanum]|uniref:receptor-interacting serine/threonine-protein kinase 4-like n=1 Tax=Copidosoma floridanum TaxID=29053 RepID=UPI0006C995A7|nr:receptor-interacting serine/threonine-protein kinase 4-like [Copidosoma floridanum]
MKNMDPEYLMSHTEWKKVNLVSGYYCGYQLIGDTRWWDKLEQHLKEKRDWMPLLVGMDVRTKLDKHGNGLLHYAAKANDEKLAAHLISSGCDVDETNHDGFSPIAVAVMFNSHRVAKLLVESKATLENVPLIYNFGLLHVAVLGGAHDCLELLLDAGVDVNSVDDDQWGLLHVAIHFKQCRENPENHKMIKKILDRGINVNTKCQNGATALDFACVHSYSTGIKQLLSAGAQGSYHTSLLMSLCSDTYDQTRTLLRTRSQRGSNRKVYEKLKHLQAEQQEKAKLLIEAGASVVHSDTKNLLILVYACATLNLDLIELLLVNGVATVKQKYCLISRVVVSPVVLPIISYNTYSLVHRNKSHDEYIEEESGREIVDTQVKCIKLLLRHGADINVSDVVFKNGHSCAPICAAVSLSHSAVVRLLLTSGASFDYENQFINFGSRKQARNLHEVIKHTAKREMLGQRSTGPLIVNFKLDTLDEDWRGVYLKCVDELSASKRTLCWSQGAVTFWNLLTDRSLESYASNQSLVSAVKKPNVERRFPIFGEEITGRFSEAKMRQRLLRNATGVLCRMLAWNVNAYPHVVRDILRNLPDTDLVSLALV